MRDRAQQSWPALSKTADGADAAARAMSASAKMMLALLPPSSSVHRFTWSAQPAMICLPTAVDPVKHTLRTSGWVTKRSPTTDPFPGTTVNTPGGRPAARPSSPSRIAVSGVSSAGFRTTVLPAARAGREAPAGDRHRKVPGHDDADHAERFAEGDVQPAGHRDLPAEEPFRRRGVVVDDVADVPRLPAGVADGVTGVRHLELGQLLEVVLDQRGEPSQQPGPLPGSHVPPGGERVLRGLDRRVGGGRVGQLDLGRPPARWPGCAPCTGSRTAWRCSRGSRHILSKERRSSQSVTAASKAASSTSAMLV